MSIPVPLVVILAGLFISAKTRLNAVILGQPVSIPVLWLVAAIVVLMLIALILWILRILLDDGGLRLRPGPVGA